MTKLFTLLFLVGIAACSNKDKIPGNVLPQEKMEALVKDMMKADQFLSDYVLNNDTSKKRDVESIKLYHKVFSIHQVQAETFYKSLDYYQQHPALLKNIFDSISKQPVRKSPAVAPVITDSLIRTPTTPVEENALKEQ